MIHILIADDHAVVRHGLRKILSDFPDMSIDGEASDAEELMRVVGERDWDVLILDISMAGRSGIDAFEDLHRSYPKLPVLFFSLMPEEQFAARLLKAGAAGYVTKDSPTEDLVTAIRRVSDGRKYISPSMAERIASGLGAPAGDLPHEKLSQREFQVFRKLAAGKPLTLIADELFLSPKTVTTHRARILEKMDLHSNAELTRYAIAHSLIE
jgi:two-component system invasion response regulator UvrY